MQGARTDTRTGTLAFMALETITNHHQDVKTELESCFLVLLFLLTGGQASWAPETGGLDPFLNKCLRGGIFGTKQGWQDMISSNIPSEAHGKLDKIKALFYPDESYSLKNVSVEAFKELL